MTAPEPLLQTPIAIFAFDRPHYLERVCESLKAQRGIRVPDQQVYLLQDGAVSAFTGVRYAEDEAIAASIATFRRYFPEGHVMASPDNLGIAQNIRRGEVALFQEVKAGVVYFLEDDLELGPHYIAMMEQMRLALAQNPRVAYFAAYGPTQGGGTGPEVGLMPLAHHWGFGLVRGAWRQIDAWMRPFYAHLRHRDYGARDPVALYELMSRHSVATRATSQDAFKSLACAELGLARVMTDVTFGRYIGEQGVHFSAKNFARYGFTEMRWAEGEAFRLRVPDEAGLAALIERGAEPFRRFRTEQLPALMEETAQGRFSPERLLTREDVEALYALLLDRKPNDAVYEGQVGKRSVQSLRQQLVRSREFRIRNAVPPGKD
jgi:hypothetical protein